MNPTDVILNFVEDKLSQPAEDQPKPDPATRSLAKGIIAGIAGGLIATAAKSIAEKIYPPRIQGEPAPPAVLADKIAGHPMEGTSKVIASETIHWAFGAVTGAAYGALAEFYPAATARQGSTFGMTLMALTHEGALPAIGLSAEPAQQSTREKSSEVVTHVIFGIVTETVRRAVRQAL